MDAIRAITQNNYSIESFYLKVTYKGAEKNCIPSLVKSIQELNYNVKQIDVAGDKVVGILFKNEKVTSMVNMCLK